MSDEATQKQNVHVPLEFLQQLARLSREGGDVAAVSKALEAIPGVARFAPEVDLAQSIHMLALELGRLIAKQRSDRGEWVFLHNGAVLTVEEATGEKRVLSAGRFIGFIEQFCAFRCSGRSNRLRDGLSREDAAIILEQDVFRDCLRPLTAVHTVRLPVARANGAPELLPAGYDEASGIFTTDLVPYAEDWELSRARDYLCEVCHEFPWNGLEDKTAEERLGAMVGNRSFAVHVLALLSSYCRGLFAPGTVRPMMAYFANKPGSGKTRLAEMALAHVFGNVGGTTAPKDEGKLDVKLETVARAMRPWVIFDDIGGGLRSHSLNKFLTETMHTGRCYNSNSEFFEVPNVTQVFVTANELPTSEDLSRRALVAEFFLAEDVRGRRFKRTITPQWLTAKSTRADFLSACWAIVRNWIAPVNHPDPMPWHPTPLESFEEMTGPLGAMVILAGLADPLQQPERDVGGAVSEDEVRQLLVTVATTKAEDCTLDRAEMVAAARENGLLHGVLGASDEGMTAEQLATMYKRFGRQMQKWRGQRLTTADGRRFQFGHKRQKSGATYPLEFMKG